MTLIFKHLSVDFKIDTRATSKVMLKNFASKPIPVVLFLVFILLIIYI